MEEELGQPEQNDNKITGSAKRKKKNYVCTRIFTEFLSSDPEKILYSISVLVLFLNDLKKFDSIF